MKSPSKNMTKRNLCLLVLISLFCYACQTTKVASNKGIQIKPKLHHISKQEYADGSREIELPQNYTPENYKKLVVKAEFHMQDSTHKYSEEKSDTFSTMLETELSKLKRFRIISDTLGNMAWAAEKDVQDQGVTIKENKLRAGTFENPEYKLMGAVSAVQEEYDRGSKNELLYIVRVDYQLIKLATKEIVEADIAEGRSKRTIIRLPSGKIIGGFNPKEEKDAYAQAAIRALAVISNKIGNKLPVGGRVKGMFGNRFQLDTGHQEGLFGYQTVTLYTNYMGIDIPFAVGEVNPGVKESSGKMIRWSDDPDVQPVITELKSNKRFLDQYDVYAVSNGMPIPPEWDNNYDD